MTRSQVDGGFWCSLPKSMAQGIMDMLLIDNVGTIESLEARERFKFDIPTTCSRGDLEVKYRYATPCRPDNSP